jgi:hypothetical protein
LPDFVCEPETGLWALTLLNACRAQPRQHLHPERTDRTPRDVSPGHRHRNRKPRSRPRRIGIYCGRTGSVAQVIEPPQSPSGDSLAVAVFTERIRGEGGMRRFGLILGTSALLIIVLLVVWIYSRPERGTTGSVSTRFHLLGPNDKIVVDGFDDPKV